MKIIDLSYNIVDNMPVFEGDEQVVIEDIKNLERDCYNGVYLKTGMHVGTHIDIPRHLLDDDRTIDEFSLDRFIGNGVLIDVRGDRVINYKKEYDDLINEGDIVLLYTDFADMYSEQERYYNEYPIVSEDFADFFIKKKIKILGMDAPSPDKFPFNIHKKLLCNDIFILENLRNLNMLKNIHKFEIYATPLKIKAEASFVRAFARVLTDNMS